MKISIITPSYNSASCIERAILSVRNQNYANWEHIIIDAASKDGTVEIIKKYDKIILLSEPDKGQSDAMNKGFKLASGEIIVYLNADDEFMPNIFDDVVKSFGEASTNQMTICDLQILEKNNVSYITKPSPKIVDIINPNKLSYPYNPVSYFYTKNLQNKIGDFPSHFHYAMDYWFLLRAYNIASIKYLPIVAGIFHNYDNKTSDIVKSETEVLNILILFLKEAYPLSYFFKKEYSWAKKKLLHFKNII